MNSIRNDVISMDIQILYLLASRASVDKRKIDKDFCVFPLKQILSKAETKQF